MDAGVKLGGLFGFKLNLASPPSQKLNFKGLFLKLSNTLNVGIL